MTTPPQGASDNRSLHELAVDISQDIMKLANGLAHQGADRNVTSQIEQTTNLYTGIAKALAAGPVGAQPVSGSPAGQPPGQMGGAPAPAPAASAPPQAPPMQQPPNRINGSSPQGAAYGDLHNTIAQMHHDSVAAVSRVGR